MKRFDIGGLVVLGAAIYAISYSSGNGIAYVGGEAFGIFLMLSLVYYAAIKSARTDFRRDLLFFLTAAVLIVSNHEKIAAYLDTRKFQSEIQASGKNNVQEAIANSTTLLGSIARDSKVVIAETNKSVDQLFNALDDNTLDGFLEVAKVKDHGALVTSNQAAKLKLAQVQLIMPAVDAMLADEKRKITAIAAQLPDGQGDSFVRGLASTRNGQRSLVQRRADNYKNLFEAAAAATDLLLAMGDVATNASGQLIFAEPTALNEYNQMVHRIQQAAQEDDEITKDAAAFEARQISDGWQKMNTPR